MASLPTGLRIGGELLPGRAEPIDVVNPATGEVIAAVAAADVEDIDHAVRVADETFRSGVWSRMAIHDRARIMHAFADGIEARMEDLYKLETMNNGRPITETKAQITRLSEWYRYNASLLLADRDAVVPLRGDYLAYTSRFPLGVVGILAPFNHPMMIASKSLAPALATGNSVVLKPSEQTPLTAMLLADIAADAGIPPGVLNVVNGLGATAGAALTEHPLVKKVVFTGGTEVGRAISLATAGRFAKATLELGGKSPVLVFDDTPIDTAARGAAFGGFIGAGQTCIAGSRLLVQRGIYDDVVGGARRAGRADPDRRPDPAGDPARPGHLRAGADAHPRPRARAASPRAPAWSPAAGPPTSPACRAASSSSRPCWPTSRNDMQIAQQEIFGPVVVVIPFDDEDDAIRQANDSPFALGSAIWTRDVARAHRVAQQLEMGMVWINDHHRLDPSSPWGGLKESGTGREGGWESFHDFTHVRAITVRTAADDVDWYGGRATGRLN